MMINQQQQQTRTLYDEDFLDLGCPPEIYDENYETDTTLWSWITNFMILVLCLLVCLKFIYCPSSLSSSSSRRKSTPPIPSTATNKNTKLMIVFFLLTGIAFGFGGLNHMTIEQNDDPLKDIYERITLGVFGVATGCLVVFSYLIVTSNKIGLWILTLISLGVTVYAVIVNDPTSIGVFQMLVTLFASIVSAFQAPCCCHENNNRRSICNSITKTIGYLLLLGGLVTQILLAPTCGDSGYEECFENCILPNPTVFNHNALFHSIYLVGLILLAVAEDRHPSIPKSAIAFHQNEQEEETDQDDIEQQPELATSTLSMENSHPPSHTAVVF